MSHDLDPFRWCGRWFGVRVLVGATVLALAGHGLWHLVTAPAATGAAHDGQREPTVPQPGAAYPLPPGSGRPAGRLLRWPHPGGDHAAGPAP